MSARTIAVGLLLTCIAITTILLIRPVVVDGVVHDAHGPIPDATIGWQGRGERVRSDLDGRFRLPGNSGSSWLVAHKPGFRITSSLSPSLHLNPLPNEDNDAYEWIDPHRDLSKPHNCANCHGEIYREWLGSAHAKSATNPKFLSLFDGDNRHLSWNARREHPDGSAVCASCHAPTLRSPTLDYDIRKAEGVAKAGVHCDYCHKVADTATDNFGKLFGRDALALLRPPAGDMLTFGPLDDAIRPGESFAVSPIYKESRYCAGCHEGVVFGVHAYATYSEWLASPARGQGKQCQTCHMAPTGAMTNIAPGKGGIEREPLSLASHHTPGTTPAMLRRAVRLQADLRDNAVHVELLASDVGHRVPTGFPDRQLILVVHATDAEGSDVSLHEGPKLPASAGNLAQVPGVLYAKQLVGEHAKTPSPFWLPMFDSTDTRLHPDQPERATFRFNGEVRRVVVQLWYRRFWHHVAASRGWTDNDTLVHEVTLDWPKR
ncbi:MAG: hypothetical protein EXS16_17805 [Gemmataceae bacterium]|nr:hypothetical protein [Gemmataceae bacterium]